MVNCQHLLDSDILINANLKVLVSLHLLNLDRIWSELLSPLHHGYAIPC